MAGSEDRGCLEPMPGGHRAARPCSARIRGVGVPPVPVQGQLRIRDEVVACLDVPEIRVGQSAHASVQHRHHHVGRAVGDPPGRLRVDAIGLRVLEVPVQFSLLAVGHKLCNHAVLVGGVAHGQVLGENHVSVVKLQGRDQSVQLNYHFP